MKKLKLIAVFLLLAAFSMHAKAVTTYDLTGVGNSATINGALFKQWDGQPMGTGNGTNR